QAGGLLSGVWSTMIARRVAAAVLPAKNPLAEVRVRCEPCSPMNMELPRQLVTLGSVAIFLLAAAAAAPAQPSPAKESFADVLQYIDHAWGVLTRSLDGCDTITDPKMPEASVLYLPAEYA